jgi:hypothetical protein
VRRIYHTILDNTTDTTTTTTTIAASTGTDAARACSGSRGRAASAAILEVEPGSSSPGKALIVVGGIAYIMVIKLRSGKDSEIKLGMREK